MESIRFAVYRACYGGRRDDRPLQAFTLVELLVSLALAGVVASAAGAILLTQMRMTTDLELAQRQRDDASRLAYLIQIEAGEASEVELGSTLPQACSGGNAKAVASFAIPKDAGSYLSASNVSRVYYFNSSGDLWRCGPEVHRNGALDHASALQAGVAVRGASIQTADCSGEVSSSSQLAYEIVYATSKYSPPCSVARPKTLLICNVGEPDC